ncbi:MAG: AAA family ATPase [Methanobacteriota archaeon]|nr:MAG: AAA family ATPase [Euryarchaeota archaeon]
MVDTEPDDDKKSADNVREEFEEKIDRLRRQYERDLHSFRYEIEEREYRLKAYEDKFNKIKQPPLLYAYVVRKEGPDLDGNQVVVARATELLKVSTGLVDKSGLGLGQYVWVHPQTYAIVEGSATKNSGVIAKVNDILDGKLVVSIEGDMEKRLVEAEKSTIKKLKPGFQISVLPPTMEVLEVLPNLEVKSLLLGEKPNVTYAMIGGLSEHIERIRDVVVLPFQEAKLFESIKLVAPKGILLYGPPGCGKTMLAKAIATENDMTFFNVSIADVLSKWVGESERIVKEIFRQAREKAPSIVFFDEIEALFTVRGMMDTSGVHKNIIAQILSEMDGLIQMENVFVLGATNRADLVDPALLRPGRFDEIIEIPRPTRQASEEIAKIYLTQDLPVPEELEKEQGGRGPAIDALRKYLIDELYGENKWVKVKLDAEAKEAIKTVKRMDIVSGAIISAIVKTAKKNYVKRVIAMKKADRKKEGLSFKDLAMAVEEECKEHAITEMYVYEKRQREVFRTGADPMVG